MLPRLPRAGRGFEDGWAATGQCASRARGPPPSLLPRLPSSHSQAISFPILLVPPLSCILNGPNILIHHKTVFGLYPLPAIDMSKQLNYLLARKSPIQR